MSHVKVIVSGPDRKALFDCHSRRANSQIPSILMFQSVVFKLEDKTLYHVLIDGLTREGAVDCWNFTGWIVGIEETPVKWKPIKGTYSTRGKRGSMEIVEEQKKSKPGKLKPGVVVYSGESLVNFQKHVVFNVYELLMSVTDTNTVIIALPNISVDDLAPLKADLSQCARAESIDLDAIVFTSIKDGKELETDRWPLGFTDGSQQLFVYLYPKEFFDSSPDAQELLFTKFIPEAQQ